MCEAAGEPSMTEALAMLDRALDALAAVDAASLPTAVQASALRTLERAGSRHAAVRAQILAAFIAQDGCAADGQGTAKAWLRWQTRITRTAAAGAVGWARRLAAHPAIAAALAGGGLSVSWAKTICGWTDRLPAESRPGADQILAEAAAGGADLADLAGLAEEIYRRTAGPDADGDDGFADRYLNLSLTWRGAGRAEGDLTPGCAAALTAVIEALARKAGPEDTRTAAQRRHDALEEACRRLIAAGMVPARAGQPTHIQLHLTLSQLRRLPSAADTEAEWATARAAEPGWLTGPAADAAACDATITPIVTGHPDPTALSQLTQAFAADGDTGGTGAADSAGGSHSGTGPSGSHSARGPQHTDSTGTDSTGISGRPANPGSTTTRQRCACATTTCACPGPRPLSEASRQRLRRTLIGLAADVLSGPAGLAARLRTSLPYPELATPSLPLDTAAPTDTIPAHLRKAVTARHPHCAFPGCTQPATICQIHHLTPRSHGGPTTLPNLLPLCSFHHLTAIHRWGWQLTLNPDATTTATSPDGTRTLHSHGPPAHAA